ncbi:MAG: golvesin C-terminal-like domain-containing protein, partial [Limisphaerales bacterium]
ALGNALVKFTASAFNLGAGTSGPLTFSGDVNVGSSTSTITDTGTNTFSGAVTNTGGFAKSGSGLLILSGNSSTAPNGPITVNAGTLRVDGTYTNSVTVASTATLGGNGTVGTSGTITLNGTISPGASPGTLTTGNETWAGGAIYRCELTNATGVAGTGWDLVNVSGTLTITATAGSPFTIKLATLKGNAAAGSMGNFSTDVTGGWKWQIATASGGIVGYDPSVFTIDASSVSNAVNGGSFSLSQTGNDLFLEFHCPARIATAPTAQSTAPGGVANFSVVAGGDLPTTVYQWKIGGVNLVDGTMGGGTVVSGATTAALVLSNVQNADGMQNAQISVAVTNAIGGNVSSAVSLTLLDPAITTQPANVKVGSPSNAVFSVFAQGTALSYQWKKGAPGSGTVVNDADFGGLKYSGSTTANLTVLNTEHAADSGSYYVTISGSGPNSPLDSFAGILSVTNPPTAGIVAPSSATKTGGTSQIFTVTFTGDPVTYQWRKNGGNMVNASGRTAGATTANLTVSNIQTSDNNATYDCVLANYAGSTTSSGATLAVQYTITTATLPAGNAASVTAAPSQSLYNDGTSVQLTANPPSNFAFQQWTINGSVVSGNPTTISITTNTTATAVFTNVTAITDIVMDNDDPTNAVGNFNVSFKPGGSSWTFGNSSSDKFGNDYRFGSPTGNNTAGVNGNNGTSGISYATATYSPVVTTPGTYDLYVTYPEGTFRTTNAPYTIKSGSVSNTFRINQQTGGGVSGGTWHLLGTGYFPAGAPSPSVVIIGNNCSTNGGAGAVIADGIKLVYSTNTQQAGITGVTGPTPSGATSANYGDTVTWSVTSDPNATSYQWKKGGNNLSNGGHVSGATTTSLIL